MAVMTFLRSMPIINDLYEVGMLTKKGEPWIGCSPDGLAIVNTKDLFIGGDDLIRIASV